MAEYNEGFSVREATLQDVFSILPLWREMMRLHAELDPRFQPHPQGEGAWVAVLVEWIAGDESAVYVAHADEKLIGYTVGVDRETTPVLLPPRHGYIFDMFVSEAWRRRGVGLALFSALRDWFRGRGLTTFRLNVSHLNPVSQAFWRSLGCQDFMDVLWGEIT